MGVEESADRPKAFVDEQSRPDSPAEARSRLKYEAYQRTIEERCARKGVRFGGTYTTPFDIYKQLQSRDAATIVENLDLLGIKAGEDAVSSILDKYFGRRRHIRGTELPAVRSPIQRGRPPLPAHIVEDRKRQQEVAFNTLPHILHLRDACTRYELNISEISGARPSIANIEGVRCSVYYSSYAKVPFSPGERAYAQFGNPDINDEDSIDFLIFLVNVHRSTVHETAEYFVPVDIIKKAQLSHLLNVPIGPRHHQGPPPAIEWDTYKNKKGAEFLKKLAEKKRHAEAGPQAPRNDSSNA